MKKLLIYSLFFSYLVLGCKKDDSIPKVTTIEVTNIRQNTVKSGGIVTDKGGIELMEKGLCWSINDNPSITDNKIADNLITNSFWFTIKDLVANTKYYLRAYATNSEGTGYGNIIIFTTLPAELPEIKNGYPHNITQTSAICGGEIISEGGSPVSSRGLCWSTNENPTIANSKIENGSGAGQFTGMLTGLSPNTTYHVRVFAINIAGTKYGNTMIVKTMYSSVTDIDGNVYKTVRIGDQEWMAENLKATHYRDGSIITDINDDTQWYNNNSQGAWCSYDNDIENKNIFGLLYNYTTTIDSKGVCPSGWHVPSDSEWTTLTNYLGGENIAGFKMKQTGEDIVADNSSGFSALMAGRRSYIDISFDKLYYNCYFWSTTKGESSSEYYTRSISSAYRTIDRGQSPSYMGFSIRCIKDN